MVNDIDPTIIVKEQGRIDAWQVVQPVWIGPRARWIFRCHHKVVSAPNACVDDVKSAVVMFDCWCEQAAAGQGHAVQINHVRTVDDIPDLGPAHQILAVEYRQARKVAERRIDHVEIILNPRD